MTGCYNSIVIDAPVDKVWSTIRDFHDLSWAKGVVETAEAVGELKGDQIGARRLLNGVFNETLVGLSDLEHTIAYTIDDGPGPTAKDAVRGYVGTVRLFPVTSDDKTFVVWTSSYESADASAVAEFCNPIYQALLGALKQHFA